MGEEVGDVGYIEYLRRYVGHEPVLAAGTLIFVFNDDRQVLMQSRTDYNQWGFPGGAMELGESFEETARRELKEETNLSIVDCEMIRILSGRETYREYPNGDKLYDITAVFVVTLYSGSLGINDGESRSLAWFGVDNLPQNITTHTRNYLEKYGDILKEALAVFERERNS